MLFMDNHNVNGPKRRGNVLTGLASYLITHSGNYRYNSAQSLYLPVRSQLLRILARTRDRSRLFISENITNALITARCKPAAALQHNPASAAENADDVDCGGRIPAAGISAVEVVPGP